jgi:hypothetical protein
MESQTLPPSAVGDERRLTRKATQTGLDLGNRTDVIAVVPTTRDECGEEAAVHHAHTFRIMGTV